MWDSLELKAQPICMNVGCYVSDADDGCAFVALPVKPDMANVGRYGPDVDFHYVCPSSLPLVQTTPS